MTASTNAGLSPREVEEFKHGAATPLQALCFALLGGLMARHIMPDPAVIVGGMVAGVVFQAVGLGYLTWLLWVFNPAVRREYGFRGVSVAVAHGFMLLFPFTVLALLAEMVLGWQAIQAFCSAGIMAGTATAGAEIAKLGGGRIRSMAIPALWGMVMTTAWMLGWGLAKPLVEGFFQ